MKPRFLKLAAVIVILLFMVTACSSTPTETTPTACTPVEVRWFVGLGTGTDPGQVELENAIVEDFNKTHPCIKLVIEIVNYESARDTLATELASGNPPDVVGPVGVSGAEAFHGMWLDMTPLIDSTGYDLEQFDKGAVEFYKVGGEGQIGLPFAIFPSMLYYQPDMFDEAGLNYPPHKYGEKYVMPDGSEVEWNYDTLRELALLLTVDINGKDATSPEFDPTQIVQYGYEPTYQDLRAVGSYWGADTFVDADGKTARIPPQWAAAWKWVYDGVWVDHFIPNQAIRESAEMASGNPFDSGKIAMTITHLWYTCCIYEAGNNWDIAAVPSYEGKTTSNFNADTFRILKDSKHPAEAFEVVQYLIGDRAMELLAVYGGMPARAKDQEAFFDGLKESFPWEIDWQVAIDGIAYADNPSFEGYMPSYQEAFDYTNTFLNMMFTTEGLNMDEEIANFKAELQVIFNK